MGVAKDRVRVRSTIQTLCDLRETEYEAKKCIERADRHRDLAPAYARSKILGEKCDTLTDRLQRLEAPRPSRAVCEKCERSFDRGRLATRCDADDDVAGVVMLGHGWSTATSRIRDFEDVQRVLTYLQKRPTWNAKELKASPHCAIPRSFGSDFVRLQNLPAWQAARLALLACAIDNRAKRGVPVSGREMNRWIREAHVNRSYAPSLRELRKQRA